MADLGLGNRATLKAHVLAATLLEGTDYDTILDAIGLGVARGFDKWCNRKFSRATGDTVTFSANRSHYYLPRFPVEQVSEVALKLDESEGFVVQADAIQNADYTKGFIYFGAVLGHWAGVVRVTFDGGFWFDTSEDDSGALPSGASPLPADIQLAWLLQCGHVWDSKDRLGVGLTEKPGQESALAALELIPEAKRLLAPHRRFQMT